jgi:drug/metabolite transporter (DMT)-like permease
MLSGITTFYAGALLFYLADALQKVTSSDVATWSYIYKRSIYTSFCAVLFTLAWSGFTDFPKPQQLLQLVGASTLCSLGLYFYIRSINVLSFSNAGALFLVGNALQQIAGIVINNEPFHTLTIPCWLLLSFGTIYQLCFTSWRQGAGYVLLSSLFWTAGYVWLSIALKGQSILWSIPIMECTILLLSVVMIWIKRESWNIRLIQTKNKSLLWVIGVSIYLASLFNHYAYQNNPLVQMSFLQLSMVPLSYVLSLKLFKEKPSRIESISFLTGFIGFAIYLWGK